jgi:NAD(P)-dependent dehydrogenase (short-subunit alcohol dehydrogenase family)
VKSIFDVSDKLIVITGGLGLLGREITQALLQEGAKVIVLDLPSNPSALDENVFYISCDITEKEQIEKCLDTIKKKFRLIFIPM